ncbi:MAG TPA: ATP-binding protein [Actinospica sp.]|nr:ATP-binding protein [Actinospica sp.]
MRLGQLTDAARAGLFTAPHLLTPATSLLGVGPRMVRSGAPVSASAARRGEVDTPARSRLGLRVGVQRFGAELSQVPVVRRWAVRLVVSVWGAGEAADDAERVISELVTNACVHGAGPVTVTVWVSARCTMLRVQDRGRWREPCGGGDEFEECGRGLAIVEALTASVRIRHGRGGRGTCVIARCPAPPDPAAPGRGGAV